MVKKMLILIGILSLATSFSLAETIKLKSGKVWTGKIIDRTDKLIKIDMGFGVPVTYYLDEIESIEKEQPSQAQKAAQPESRSTPAASIYVNEKYGISIVGPKEWNMENLKEKKKGNYKLLVSFLRPGIKKDSFPSSISVYVEDEPEDTKQAFLDRKTWEKGDQLARQTIPGVGFKIIEGPEETIVNGNEMIRIINETNLMGMYSKELLHMCWKNNKIYYINASSLSAADFDKDYSNFQEAVNSLQIK